ncbi:MAG: ABC transporter ATP-binding protein [Bacteroidia bacterium]|nr:ABC transporter ATP-binding protein [Bacteroidia bacterium]
MSLKISKLNREFGGIKAVHDFDLTLPEGKITALIGPNGAGKTTIFNLITGFLRPTGGVISWRGQTISNVAPYHIVRRGISRTFQEVKLFRSLTVGENLLMAKSQRAYEGLFASFIQRKEISHNTRNLLEEISQALKGVQLDQKINSPASALSYGQSKLVEILRAALTGPELLLLDEPAAGLNPIMIDRIKTYILFLARERGMTILFIEHNIPFIFELADWVVVVDHGVKIAEGTPAAIKNAPGVIKAYLG